MWPAAIARSAAVGRALTAAATVEVPAAMRLAVRAGDSDGYACAALLPSRARSSGWLVRAFNLELATVRDAARGNRHAAHLRFDFWRDFVAAVYERRGHSHPLYAPLVAAVTAHGLSRRWFDRMIEARDADVEAAPPKTMAELREYADATAGSVVQLGIEACGAGDDGTAAEAASHVGVAAGLATVLRGLPVHARLGQRYVPDDVLAAAGLTDAEWQVQEEELTLADGTSLAELARAGRAGNGNGGAGSRSDGIERPSQQQPSQPPPASSAASSPKPTTPAGTSVTGVQLRGSRAMVAAIARGGGSADAAGSARTARTGGARGAAPTPVRAPAAVRVQHQPRTGAASHGGDGSGQAAEARTFDARELRVGKAPAVLRRIDEATLMVAAEARRSLEQARRLALVVSPLAVPALLPAVAAEAALEALEAQCRGRGLYGAGLLPVGEMDRWRRLRLQARLLAAVVGLRPPY